MSQDGCHDLAELSDVNINRTLVEGSNMKVEEKEKSADQTETISRETKKNGTRRCQRCGQGSGACTIVGNCWKNICKSKNQTCLVKENQKFCPS